MRWIGGHSLLIYPPHGQEGNKWCKQCWGLRILWNKSSSAFSTRSETLRLSDLYPNIFFRRLNIASTLPISSADTIRDTMTEYTTTLSLSDGIPWCCNSFRRYIRWEHSDIKKCTCESIFRLSWKKYTQKFDTIKLFNIIHSRCMWKFETRRMWKCQNILKINVNHVCYYEAVMWSETGLRTRPVWDQKIPSWSWSWSWSCRSGVNL